MGRKRGDHCRARPATEARAMAWRSIRILRRFTSAQVEATATIKRDNATRYITGLLRAGYLRVSQANVSGCPGSFHVYQLVRDTGPLAPILWENGQVFDPNTSQAYGDSTGGFVHDVVLPRIRKLETLYSSALSKSASLIDASKRLLRRS